MTKVKVGFLYKKTTTSTLVTCLFIIILPGKPMVELANLQQTLSMSSVTEKVQQVQQQLPDVQTMQNAAELRLRADIQKNRVQETEEGNPYNLIQDKQESAGNKSGKRKPRRQKEMGNKKLEENNMNAAEIPQGRIVNVSI